MTDTMHHRIVIVGGGSAGITVAARLRNAGQDDIAIVEPSSTHYYQPLWTLVGAGAVDVARTARPEAKVMPRGVRWVQDRAAEIDPDTRVVTTAAGARIGYDFLVVAPGIQLDWDVIPGLTEGLERGNVTSNYRADLAPRTWQLAQSLQGGNAVFTMPAGPFKCGGGPQKAAYLTADHLRKRGALDKVSVIYASPADRIFGLPEYAAVLEGVVARYGIDTRFTHELVEVRPDDNEAVFRVGADGRTDTIPYDMLHVVPPQSAPDFLKGGPLAIPGDAKGFVDVHKHTLQHVRYPEVFAIGDASGAPNSKTGAAVRKQAPVVVRNVQSVIDGKEPDAEYDGYSSCPLITAYGKVVLAEFDYTGQQHKTVPVIDTVKERYDMWLLKRYGLPFIYWNLMLRGRA